MKLYTITLLAWRHEDDEYRLRVKPGIVLATSHDDAIARGLAACKASAYPASEGWGNHQVVAAEVPSPLELDGYTLTWQVEAIG